MTASPASTTTAPMSATGLLAELRSEGETTRRVLSRLPEEHLGWQPHPKSMSLGALALHLAQLPWGIAMLVEELSVELPTVPLTEPGTRAEVLAALDHSLAYAAARLEEWGDHGLAEQWTLTQDGTPLMSMPRGALLRALMFNHVYHHRGQLTVYLRLLDVPLPPVYGPTADENPLA